MITLKQAVEKTGIKYITLMKRVESGSLKAVKEGGTWMIDEQSLADWKPQVTGPKPQPLTYEKALRQSGGDEWEAKFALYCAELAAMLKDGRARQVLGEGLEPDRVEFVPPAVAPVHPGMHPEAKRLLAEIQRRRGDGPEVVLTKELPI